MNVELEIRKLTESYCVENNIPIKRRFTHAELEHSIEQIREAAEQAKSLPLLLVEQTLAAPLIDAAAFQVNAEKENV